MLVKRSKKHDQKCENVCVKIRKSVMDETLEYLREIRKQLENQKQQVA